MKVVMLTLVLVLFASSPSSANEDELRSAIDAENYEAAAELANKLARKGNPFAQYTLGMMRMQGHGISKDYAEAAMWFDLAGRQGKADALVMLALMHKRRLAPDHKLWKAWSYLWIAHELGKKDARRSAIAIEPQMSKEDFALGLIETKKWKAETGLLPAE